MAGAGPAGVTRGMLQRTVARVKAYAIGRVVRLDASGKAGHTARMTQIYKILRAPEYAAFRREGHTWGAPIDLADGYIHLSAADQVAGTLSKHFAGEEGLVLLALDAEPLGEALRWEESRGGALFPHLYREMKAQDVLWARDLPLLDATHVLDGLIP